MGNDLSLRELLEIYKSYSSRHGLSTYKHLTHILLIICQLCEASLLLNKSRDVITDKTADVIQSMCKFYQQLDALASNYEDLSTPFSATKEKEPLLYLSLIADALIHILIYIGGNNWIDTFMDILINKAENDNATDINDSCRFVVNRLSYKLNVEEESKIE